MNICSWAFSPVPRKAWIAVLGAGATWYGRQIAMTYGPGVVKNLFVQAHYWKYGNSMGQKVWAHLIVAPTCVPRVTPYVDWVAGAVFGIVVVQVGNFVDRRVEKAKIPDEKKPV